MNSNLLLDSKKLEINMTNEEENVFNDENALNELKNISNQEEVTDKLGKVETEFIKKQKSVEESKKLAKNIGWRKLDIGSLPSKGRFNKHGMILEYRPLSLNEIKEYSMGIDDSDPISINDSLNGILKKCIRIRYPNMMSDYKDIIDYDRLFLIFIIRDISMMNHQRETKIYQETPCKCGQITIKKEITSQEFSFLTIKQGLNKYYDAGIRGFRLNDPNNDIDLSFFIPSIGVFEEVKKYINEKNKKKEFGQKNHFYDLKFLEYYQFMVSDWKKISEKSIDEAYIKWLNDTNIDETSLIVKMCDMLSKISIKSETDIKCTKQGCQEVTKKPIVFQEGYRSIFDFSDISKGLFSDAFDDVD